MRVEPWTLSLLDPYQAASLGMSLCICCGKFTRSPPETGLSISLVPHGAAGSGKPESQPNGMCDDLEGESMALVADGLGHARLVSRKPPPKRYCGISGKRAISIAKVAAPPTGT